MYNVLKRIYNYRKTRLPKHLKELAWRSGNVMDCHVTARGSIPSGNGVFTELHILCKGQ